MEPNGELELRKRAFELARSGDFAGWGEIRRELANDGYLMLFAPLISDDSDFHAAIDTVCAESKSR